MKREKRLLVKVRFGKSFGNQSFTWWDSQTNRSTRTRAKRVATAARDMAHASATVLRDAAAGSTCLVKWWPMAIQHKSASGTEHLSWWQRGPIEVNLRRSHQNQSPIKLKMDHQNVNQCVTFSESKQTFTRFLVWFGWWKWPHVAWRVSRENE